MPEIQDWRLRIDRQAKVHSFILKSILKLVTKQKLFNLLFRSSMEADQILYQKVKKELYGFLKTKPTDDRILKMLKAQFNNTNTTIEGNK